jgi:hypothetical protein
MAIFNSYVKLPEGIQYTYFLSSSGWAWPSTKDCQATRRFPFRVPGCDDQSPKMAFFFGWLYTGKLALKIRHTQVSDHVISYF